MKMPEQLTEDELRKEVVALRNILKQSQAKIQELANGWGLKRLEMMFEMLKINKFSPEIEAIVKQGICEDLGIIGIKETDEIE